MRPIPLRRRRRARAAGSDVHVFVVWPLAAADFERILADIERTFRVHELIRLRWTTERFAENLARFYGPALPPGVDKLSETGQGDVLVIVVSDPKPRYRLRRRTLGRLPVNVNVFDAKQRYRAWTGGGHLVHATNDRAEAARDLHLLLGRTLDTVTPPEDRTRPDWQVVDSDLIGAEGWSSFTELLTAMEHSGGYVLLNPGSSPPQVLTHDEWSVEILKARPVDAEGLYHVIVAGRPVPLGISWVGDGRLPVAQQRAMLLEASSAAGTLRHRLGGFSLRRERG